MNWTGVGLDIPFPRAAGLSGCCGALIGGRLYNAGDTFELGLGCPVVPGHGIPIGDMQALFPEGVAQLLRLLGVLAIEPF